MRRPWARRRAVRMHEPAVAAVPRARARKLLRAVVARAFGTGRLLRRAPRAAAVAPVPAPVAGSAVAEQGAPPGEMPDESARARTRSAIARSLGGRDELYAWLSDRWNHVQRRVNPYVAAYVCAIQNAFERLMEQARLMLDARDSPLPTRSGGAPPRAAELGVARVAALLLAWKFAVALSPHFQHEAALLPRGARWSVGWIRSLYPEGVDLPEDWATWATRLLLRTWAQHDFHDLCSQSDARATSVVDAYACMTSAPPLSRAEARVVLDAVREVVCTGEWLQSAEWATRRRAGRVRAPARRVALRGAADGACTAATFEVVTAESYRADPSPVWEHVVDDVLDESQTFSVDAIRHVCILRDVARQVELCSIEREEVRAYNRARGDALERCEPSRAFLECRMPSLLALRCDVGGDHPESPRASLLLRVVPHATCLPEWMAANRKVSGPRGLVVDSATRHSVVLQVLQGVLALHGASPRAICHRDIRPQNIEVYSDRAGQPVVVLTGLQHSRYVSSAWTDFALRESSRMIARAHEATRQASVQPCSAREETSDPFASSTRSSTRSDAQSVRAAGALAPGVPARLGHSSGRLVLERGASMRFMRESSMTGVAAPAAACGREVAVGVPAADVADFESARSVTMCVGSLGYLPPETLLGIQASAFDSDMWSVGCTILEILQDGRALFPDGLDVRSVANRVIRLCYHCRRGGDGMDRIAAPRSVEEIRACAQVRCCSHVADPTLDLELVSNMLVAVPEDRWTAETAVEHVLRFERDRYVRECVATHAFVRDG